MGRGLGRTRARGVRVLLALPLVLACSGESGGSGGAYDAHLPPPYKGPAGTLTSRTPCPAPIAWPQTLTFNEVTASYDSTRGRIVYTSHDAGGGPFFLWDWDNASDAFTLRTQCGTNIPRDDTAAAYDPDIRAVLLLGGSSPVEIHVDSGEIEPIPAPPVSTGATYFYDALAKGVIVTDVGTDHPPTETSMRWDDVAKAWKPSGVGLGYVGVFDEPWAVDSKREKLYVLSGIGSTSSYLLEIDVATGAAQTLMASQLPPEFADFAYRLAVYDSRRDRLVVVSGEGTWEWDIEANAWSKAADANSAPLLDNSMAAQIVFDEKAGLVTLFEQGKYEPQVWTWDGAAWKAHRPPHIQHTWPALPYSSRTKEMPFTLTYDPDRRRTLLFAASDDEQTFGNTMEWDGRNWVDRTPVDPTHSPPSRSNAALTYDTVRHRAVLYGDEKRGTDVWEWDGEAGVWTNRTPSPLPSKWPFGDDFVRTAFNPATGTVFLYEGTTWQWSGAAGTWSESPAGFVAVDLLQLVFDERLGRIVLLGSSFGAFGTAAYDAGTQKWAVLHPAGMAVSPIAAGVSGAAYDPVRGTIAVFGGASVPAKLVEYDTGDGTVKDTTPSMVPAEWPSKSETAAAMAYDVDRGVLVILTQDGEVFERPSQ